VTKLFDSSSIPDTEAYWDALASRVAHAAHPRRSGLTWLGAERFAWFVAACITVLAGVGVMLGRGVAISGATPPRVALTPRDPIGRIFAGAESPPALTELTALLPRDKGESP
jgi:hypothetical protein